MRHSPGRVWNHLDLEADKTTPAGATVEVRGAGRAVGRATAAPSEGAAADRAEPALTDPW